MPRNLVHHTTGPKFQTSLWSLQLEVQTLTRYNDTDPKTGEGRIPQRWVIINLHPTARLHTPQPRHTDADVQLGHHLPLSHQPHLANLMRSNSTHLHYLPLHELWRVPLCSLLYKNNTNTSLCIACTMLRSTHLLQTFRADFGANFFTASPTDRNILSSPMSSVNFADRSVWIAAGRGLARICCRWHRWFLFLIKHWIAWIFKFGLSWFLFLINGKNMTFVINIELLRFFNRTSWLYLFSNEENPSFLYRLNYSFFWIWTSWLYYRIFNFLIFVLMFLNGTMCTPSNCHSSLIYNIFFCSPLLYFWTPMVWIFSESIHFEFLRQNIWISHP